MLNKVVFGRMALLCSLPLGCACRVCSFSSRLWTLFFFLFRFSSDMPLLVVWLRPPSIYTYDVSLNSLSFSIGPQSSFIILCLFSPTHADGLLLSVSRSLYLCTPYPQAPVTFLHGHPGLYFFPFSSLPLYLFFYLLVRFLTTRDLSTPLSIVLSTPVAAQALNRSCIKKLKSP